MVRTEPAPMPSHELRLGPPLVKVSERRKGVFKLLWLVVLVIKREDSSKQGLS